MGYEQFFGLNDAPFTLAPNPRYLFDSASHADALKQLAYAIDRREPLIVVTGEIGTGKTLLCRTVLQRLDRRTFVSVINDPLLDRDDLLKQMLQDFGIMSTDRAAMPSTSRHDLVHALEDFLSSLIALDAHGVVMIDEAQHVQPDVLEQIRLLASVDAPTGTRLQIVLVGQLDLEALLARPELRQFQQRVSRRIRLEPLRENELRAYIDHRLAIGRAAGSLIPNAEELARELAEWEAMGGGGGVTFTPSAVSAVWRWSNGLPRVVNLLCDRSLEAAYAQRLRTIDDKVVDAAAAALQLEAPPSTATTAEGRQEHDAEHLLAAKPSSNARSIVPLADVAQRGAEHVDPVKAPPSPPPTPGIWSPDEAGSAYAPTEIDPLPSGSKRPTAVIVMVAVVVVAAAAFWFTQTRRGSLPPDAQGAPATAPPASAAPAIPAATAPAASLPPLKPSQEPAPTPPPPLAAAGSATNASFEILVASFKTEPRAAAVAAQVSAAGLNVRQRATGGWQQVLAGPFASRAEADAGRARLERAGLTGTQIIAAEH